jgi:uncharacterized membrane protein YraQ (UPF0718 family)
MGGVMWLFKSLRRGFWREAISRDNSVVSTMAVISLIISAPVVAVSIAALVYDIFWLAHGLKDPSVRLLLGLISASTAGLAVSQFSKRSAMEMFGGAPDGGQPPAAPVGDKPPRAKPAPPQGE